MSEYIFVHLIDDQPKVNDLGLEIPLHTTLLHWFETDRAPDEILSLARAALRGVAPVETIATHNDLFGPDNNVPVMRLKRTPELLNLHLLLLDSMVDSNTTFDQRWVGANNWNPHVTTKAGQKLYTGERVVVDSVSFIQRKQPDRHRIILGNVFLED